jgi:rRNA processing protein Gar1
MNTQTFLIGRGDVTFLHIAYVKSTKNVGKLTCVFGRFKNPFFSVANTDFEGGGDDHGYRYGDCIFLVIYAQPSHASLGPPGKK